MKRYGVSFTTTASTIVYVEADSPEDAIVIADEKFEPPTICASCAGWGSDDDSNSGIELSDWEASDDTATSVWEA